MGKEEIQEKAIEAHSSPHGEENEKKSNHQPKEKVRTVGRKLYPS